MPSRKPFGRRANSMTALVPAVETGVGDASKGATAAAVENKSAPVPNLSTETSADVDRELEDWKAARKRQRRSFREPWRTLAIGAAVGFGVSSWILPDSVADIAELLTGGLGAASLFAGLRLGAPSEKLSSEIGE